MRNFITIIVVFMLVLSSCDTTKKLTTANSKEIMKNKEAINAFYNKALTVNTETRPTAVLTLLMASGYKSSSSVDAKGAEQLMGARTLVMALVSIYVMVTQNPLQYLVVLLMNVIREGLEMVIDPLYPVLNAPATPM